MHNMRILRHVLGWAMWFTVTSCFSFLWFFIYDRPLPTIPTLYSFITLMIIYYASYYASRNYFRSHITADSSPRVAVLQYLFSWRVIYPLLIIGIYFAAAWFIESWFVSAKLIPRKIDEVLPFMDAKFSRACFYLALPMYFAADDCLLAKKDKVIEGESKVNAALLEEMGKKNEVYEKKFEDMEALLARIEINFKKTP